MWGGVKARKTYTDLFKQWSATKGLESLRGALYLEPRPWFLAFSLHQQQHLLPDHQCARLISWCTTVVQLTKNPTDKQKVYRHAQETFGMLSGVHKAGAESILEYLRLCAVGCDLTSAFEWYQYWLDSKKEGGDTLTPLVWLLRIALLTPSDEHAEDMISAVKDAYSMRFCIPMTHEDTKDLILSHCEPTTPEMKASLRNLYTAFKALRPRILDTDLAAFVDALPVEDEEVQRWLAAGWPHRSHHHVFPHLEAGLLVPAVSVAAPRLRDSILHPQLVEKLESAAFAHDTTGVIGLVKQYAMRVTAEKEKKKPTQVVPEDDIWRQYSDRTAQRFRAELVEGGGLTPELYHYVVVSLARTQPTAALRTLKRMRDANLRILDLTRAVVLVSCSGSFADQLELFKEQLQEVDSREQLDRDFNITKVVELYWKYQYTDLFHYLNALDRESFFEFLMNGIGIAAVQKLLLESEVHGSVPEEDLVIVDESLRVSAVNYLRKQRGSTAVEEAIDITTSQLPKLDISLISTVPHFSDYTLTEGDSIATDTKMLQSLLEGYDIVYVLDTSFVETGEAFLTIGDPNKRVLVLVPYSTLKQLSESVTSSATFVSFDQAMQESLRAEPSLASQRLRALFALLHNKHVMFPHRRVRLLHFTECLLTQGASSSLIDRLGLQPEVSDNDAFVLMAALLRTLMPSEARLILCADDVAIPKTLERMGSELMPHAVEVLTTDIPAVVDAQTGTINDNPTLGLDVHTFTPKLDFPKLDPEAKLPTTPRIPIEGTEVHEGVVNREHVEGLSSAWLSMLDDEGPTTTSLDTKGVAPVEIDHPPSTNSTIMKDGAHDIDLMNLYESDHDVVPIGVKMKEASAISSVFEQFDVMEPEKQAAQERDQEAQASRLRTTGTSGKPSRRRSHLEKEMLQNRGFSVKMRYKMAKDLSNMSGGRVPFNLRYKVVEANVNDPRNAHLRDTYARSVQRKREHFRKNYRE